MNTSIIFIKKNLKEINLSRLKKCQQKWEDMDAVDGGRLCRTCSKVIVDLRRSSPEDIRKMHILHPNSLCGVYNEYHFSEEEKKPFLGSKEFALLGISLLPLISSAQADQTAKPKTEQSPIIERKNYQVERLVRPNQSDSVFISGSVVERLSDGSKQPIPFASVFIPELDMGTTTSADGFFEINLSLLKNVPDTVTVMVQFIGFGKQTIPNVATNQSHVFNVALLEQEMIAFGVTLEAPKKKGLWARFKSLFMKKEK